MTVVQTFWTGKSQSPENESFGWLRPEYHHMSWALSVNLLRRQHKDVVLYTDRKGEELLVKKLNLPYTDVKVVLDELNSYDPDLWALSKIQTYSLQEEPFIHVDGDVFVWAPLPEALFESKLVAQNLENGGQGYLDILKGLKSHLKYFPKAVRRNADAEVYTYNAGIFGGSDLEFYERYAREAFAFVKQNRSVIDKLPKTSFNIFLEQYLYYCMVKDEGRQVDCLFPSLFPNPYYLGFGNFDEVPNKRWYLHLVSRFKKNRQVLHMMESQLRQEFPDTYTNMLRFFESGARLKAPSGTTAQLFEGFTGQKDTEPETSAPNGEAALLKRDLSRFADLQQFVQSDQSEQMSTRLELDYHVAFANPKDFNQSTDPAQDLMRNQTQKLAIVPEMQEAVLEVPLDELDVEIIDFLKERPRQLDELLNHLVQYFEDESEHHKSPQYITLITARVRALLLDRVVQVKKENQSFNSNLNNLGRASYRLFEEDRA